MVESHNYNSNPQTQLQDPTFTVLGTFKGIKQRDKEKIDRIAWNPDRF